jgi:cytochrome c553
MTPTIITTLILMIAILAFSAQARNPIRRTFFDTYPEAAGTWLDDLPSNAGHCGVCHFDFDGGGPRNAYGLAVEVGLGNGLSNAEAIAAVDGNDSDADGFSNRFEATDTVYFSNTPTFPGLYAGNYTNAVNVDLADISPHLTPAGANDSIPPVVTLNSPNGGEDITVNSYYPISYTATDESGISHVNIYLSTDGGATYKPVALNEPPGTGFSWFVPSRPGTENRIVIEAIDNAGNDGEDESDADFTISGAPVGVVPTTLNDVDMPGTQPLEGALLDDPDLSCATCHGNYDSDVEPWYTWRGSMMSQAARDPFFFACMAIAEQDAPSAGDLCIRCHSPGGWQEGRSVDTSGDLLTAKDRHGVHCDFCHRAVDFNYVPGVSPVQDVEVLDEIEPLPLQYANGQFINDPAPLMRGPYSDANASHAFVESPFHRSANMCGTCHDVSNTVFNRNGTFDYVPNAFNEPHPDSEIRNMAPVERTFSEWSMSEYATTGVYAPQFAGDKPDGMVSTCQDCHMRDVTGTGCNEPGAPTRTDLALHDMMGGNTFVVDIIDDFFPDEVDVAQLQAAKARAIHMIQLAATLELTAEDFGVTVRVINETGHKLPSGYPEGRRVWLNVKAYDSTATVIYQSGAYDFDTADLIHDEDAKIYEIHPGISPGLGAALGVTPGKSFHFVLSDTVYDDNRIPPRGFTNANFETIQSAPVGHAYADGQYWDDTQYHVPSAAESVQVTLYYQSTSKEYIEFLRDENVTNSAGQDLYDAWFAQGKCPPVVIASASIPVDVTAGVTRDDRDVELVYALNQNFPNPFGPATAIEYSLAMREHVNISVYDLAGRHVCSLVDEVQDPDRYRTEWDGRNSRGEELPPGVYFIRYCAGNHLFSRKATLLR